MKRGNIFWGIIFIIAAGLLLLKSLGVIDNFFGFFWALTLLAIGIGFLVNALTRSPKRAGEKAVVLLEGCTSAVVKLEHGAGRLNIHSGISSSNLVEGEFSPAPIVSSTTEGSKLNVKIKNLTHFFSWFPGESRDWDISLIKGIPLVLDIDSGASIAIVDLHDLLVSELDLDTGASTTDITLPANAGYSRIKIDSGAATVKIHIPEGVAAQIQSKSGMASINVNKRFPKTTHDRYLSPDYATATNRADILIETGMASVEII